MSFFTTDGNGIQTCSPTPTGDAGLALNQNFAAISALITTANQTIASLQTAATALTSAVAGKASKASPAVSGHAASLDSNGNVVDSGMVLGSAATHSAGDFDAAGSAASVSSALASHEAATGTTVHGLGTASTHSATDFDPAGSAAVVQSNLNSVSATVSSNTAAIATKLTASNNLSDLTNSSTARTNLGLATVASSGSYHDLSNKPAFSFGVQVRGPSGSPITIGSAGFRRIPFNGTITGVTLLADRVGSVVVDIQKGNYSTYPTTTSITASDIPTITAAQKQTDTTLTGWTTSVTAGDIIQFVIQSASTIQTLQVYLDIVPN